MRRGRRLALVAAPAAAGVVVVVLVLAQLLLPGIATSTLRDRLSRHGQVLSLKISAFPAIQLLWHHADSVTVRMRDYRSSAGGLADSLGQTSGVDSLHASIGTLTSGALTLHDVTLTKQGDRMTGGASLSDADLRSALPILQSVRPVGSVAGGVVLRGTASVVGVSASVDATVQARDGAIVVAPRVPFGGFASITVFSDPQVRVQAVNAATIRGGLSLSARGVTR